MSYVTKKIKKWLSTCSIIFSLTLAGNSIAMQRNTNIDLDWKFKLDDHSSYMENNLNDNDWREINLPHDWSIEGKYDQAHPSGKRYGWLPTGTAWYRKNLQFDPSWVNKRVILRFDGVYLNSDVWVNEKHMGHRPNGYVSFGYDITDALYKKGKPIKDTVISVRVDHKLAPTGRWYTGSGIYRHVWLDVVDKTYVTHNGIFATTEAVDFTSNKATLKVSTDITGIEDKANLTLKQTLSLAGKTLASVQKQLPSGYSDHTASQLIFVEDAKLWSPESPTLYQLTTTITKDNQLIDTHTTNVGIRTIDYNVKQGFLLNNKTVKFKGMSLHHDAGPVGAAVPDDVWRFRLKQMKDMGMNALRPAHTPFPPIFYQLADEMGFMVMDEAFDGWETEKAKFDYGLHFEQWWQTDLESIIKRDRNHPSIVMWSIGNEVIDATAETQKKLVNFVKNLDSTRPITQGRGYMLGHLDVDGFNGHGEYKGYLEEHFKHHPNKTQVGTEITHTLSTRGIYRTRSWYRDQIHNPFKWEQIKDKVNYVDDLTEEELFPNENPHYSSSYDNAIVRMNIRDELKMVKKLPYLLGTFRWTAYDYIGESRKWPARTRNFGVLDLASFEKDPYYLYQSQWSNKPMVHMLPHWTHPGKEGVKIPVVVYTNQASAELFLNGKSLGKKTMTDEMQLLWYVPYQAGELKVIAGNGKNIVSQTISTAGAAATTKLTSNRESVTANQTDTILFTIDIVDKNGHFVPRADNQVEFELSGPAKLLGAENGDILDLTQHKTTTRKVFNGKLRVFVQATGEQGSIKLTVRGENLVPKQIGIASKKG